MSLASASTETTTNVWKSRAADLFSSYMVMIGCSPEPCRHSADVLRIPVSEWLSPPRRVESDDIKWQQRYGRVHTRFRKLRDRNHGPSLVLQMVLHGAKENWIGEPTAVMFRRQLALDAGGFRTDIYQLVDVDFWLRLMLRSAVCFVPHELSVRRHTAATETTRVMATRRNVLDRQRILTGLIVDPLSPNSVRSAAALWWIPAWLAMIVEVAVLGPQRRTHLKALAPAPFREFAHARRQLPMAD